MISSRRASFGDATKAPIGELRSLESAPSVRKTWSFRFERGDMLVAPTPSV